MGKSGVRAAVVGGLAAAVLAAAGCGGSPQTSATATRPSPSTSATAGATPSATDAAFVNGLCRAGKQFSDSLTQVLKDPAVLNNPKNLVATLQGPYDQFAKAFAAVTPPPDLRQWHTDTVKALNDAASKVKQGQGLDQLFSSGTQLVPRLPTAAAARLSALVASNPDCASSGLNFGSLSAP